MKKKNGFFAISIIFSFFIVFLMLITMNLTRYAQNRILLSQVKKDIKTTSKLKVENHTLICKRADISTIHQTICEDGAGCRNAGYSSSTSEDTGDVSEPIITYGNMYRENHKVKNNGTSTGISGVLNPGDAFDCKISENGDYTERFYYVTDYDNAYYNQYYTPNGITDNTKYAILIYSKTLPNMYYTLKYSTGDGNIKGPYSIETDPSIMSQLIRWNNVKLRDATRYLLYENNVSLGYYSYRFNVRPIMYQELLRGCPEASTTTASLRNCTWLLENTRFDSYTEHVTLAGVERDVVTTTGYWMETLHNGVTQAWYVSTLYTSLDYASVTSQSYSYKPVIEVPYDRLEINFKEAS